MTEKCVNRFKEIFGSAHGVCCFAPGRVNLIGEHTDYNGGFVFPCAINMGIYGVAAARSDNKIRLFSLDFENTGIIETKLDSIEKTNTWADYPLGVINAFESFGIKIPFGADMLFYGNLPNGAGLSSSAAIEVLTATIIKNLFSLDISGQLAAVIGQFAENRFVGVNCGIMDQFVIAMGEKDNAVLLNSNSLKWRYIPVMAKTADIVVINSCIKRTLAGSAFNERRRECETALGVFNKTIKALSLCEITPEQFEAEKGLIADENCRNRARHVIYENARVLAAADAMKNGDLTEFGMLMNKSHYSLRDNYAVSCEQLDFLTEKSREYPGVYGSKMTGAGFGGCTVTLINKEHTAQFTDYITKEYSQKYGIKPEVYNITVSDGARLMFDF